MSAWADVAWFMFAIAAIFDTAACFAIWREWPLTYGAVTESGNPYVLLEGTVRAVAPLRDAPDGSGPCVFAIGTRKADRLAEAERIDQAPLAFVLERPADAEAGAERTVVVVRDAEAWQHYEPAWTSRRFDSSLLLRLLRWLWSTIARRPHRRWLCVREGEPVMIWAYAQEGFLDSNEVAGYRDTFGDRRVLLLPPPFFEGGLDRRPAIGVGTRAQQRRRAWLVTPDSPFMLLFVIMLPALAFAQCVLGP